MDFKKWFTEKCPHIKDRKNAFILGAGLLGILLILFSELIPSGKSKASQGPFEPLYCGEYVSQLESRLCSLIEEVDGAGKCRVMVTLEQGVQYVYASEDKKTQDETQSRDGNSGSKVQQKDNIERKIVVIEENGDRRPLIETSREPTVKGVAVVCEGGSSSVVKQQITEVLTTVLGIRTSQVYVAPKE